MAVLVGVVPGYFWARALAPLADAVERVTYSTALSMTLVPTAALLQARVFDTGVTFFIAAASMVAVFAAGFAAYLWFGTASYTEEPVLDPPPAPPGAYALVPLLVAFALMLAVASGLVPEGRSPFVIALLLLLAGVATSLASRPPLQPRSGLRWPPVSSALIAATLLMVLLRGYLGPVLHDWPFIRGGDQFSHAVMAELMMTEGKIEPYLIYPPGFHTLVACISRLSGLTPLEVFPVLAPTLLLLPAPRTAPAGADD